MPTLAAEPSIFSQDRVIEIEAAERLLDGILIPPCSETLIQVMDEQSKEDPNIQHMAVIIGRDVALSASVLKVVNSPLFALRRQISSIHQAVRLVGTTNIASIVTGLMLKAAFNDIEGAFMKRYRDASNRMAIITTVVARRCMTIPQEEAYALGLFADCGIPLMVRRFPVEYPRVYNGAMVQQQMTLGEYEYQHLGTNHTLLGYVLAKSWQLPAAFCKAILHHHDRTNFYQVDPLNEVTNQIAVLQLADQVHRDLRGRRPSLEWERFGADILAHVGFDEGDMEVLTDEIVAIARAMQGQG